MTPNEQTAVEAIKHHLWTYRTGGLSRDTFLSFMKKEIALLEASPTVPVNGNPRWSVDVQFSNQWEALKLWRAKDYDKRLDDGHGITTKDIFMDGVEAGLFLANAKTQDLGGV